VLGPINNKTTLFETLQIESCKEATGVSQNGMSNTEVIGPAPTEHTGPVKTVILGQNEGILLA